MAAAALGSGGKARARRTEYRCGSCPCGSETAADAIPLGLAGNEGSRLVSSLGVSDAEAWCPHCRKFALWVIRRIAR